MTPSQLGKKKIFDNESAFMFRVAINRVASARAVAPVIQQREQIRHFNRLLRLVRTFFLQSDTSISLFFFTADFPPSFSQSLSVLERVMVSSHGVPDAIARQSLCGIHLALKCILKEIPHQLFCFYI